MRSFLHVQTYDPLKLWYTFFVVTWDCTNVRNSCVLLFVLWGLLLVVPFSVCCSLQSYCWIWLPEKQVRFFILLDFVWGEFSYGFNKSLGLSNQRTTFTLPPTNHGSGKWVYLQYKELEMNMEIALNQMWLGSNVHFRCIYDSWILENRLLKKEYAPHVMSMPTCRSTWGMQSSSVPFVHKWFFGGGEWSSLNRHPHINSCTYPEQNIFQTSRFHSRFS